MKKIVKVTNYHLIYQIFILKQFVEIVKLSYLILLFNYFKRYFNYFYSYV